MTALLAIEHDAGVVLGSDSCVASEHERWIEDHPKYWRLGPLVIAMAGSARATLVAEAAALPRGPRRGERDVVYLSTVVGEAVRVACAAVECAGGVEALLVWRGRAYYMDGAYSVTHPACGVIGAGSGGIAARAAALALAGVVRDPVERARRALVATASMCPGVAPPFHVLDVRTRARRK